MIQVLSDLELNDKKVLIIVNELDENLILASRNLPNIMVIEPTEMNVLDLVNTNVVLTTKETMKKIEEVLK